MRKISALTLAAFGLLTAAPAFADDYLLLPPRVHPRLSPPQMAELGHDAQAGNPSDQWLIGAGYAFGGDGKRDPAAALAWLSRAADQGYLAAEVDLASEYYSGGLVSADKTKAAEWLRRAADHGSSDAQLALGELCFAGAGVTRDYSQAYVWYSLSAMGEYMDKKWIARLVRDAAKHMTPAQLRAAKLRIKAWRVLPPEPGQVIDDGQRALYRDDPAEAVRLWTPLANDGNAVAQYELAKLYMTKIPVPAGGGNAIAWLQKAAAQGHAVAQYDLGRMYDYGDGVAEDRALAWTLYHKAADQGLGEAQFEVGMLTAAGYGVAKDDAAAAVWYRKAADQSVSRAQLTLGQAYQDGAGVQTDDAEAYKWMLLAIAHEGEPRLGSQWSILADRVAARLTPEQRDAVRQQVADWQPVYQMVK